MKETIIRHSPHLIAAILVLTALLMFVATTSGAEPARKPTAAELYGPIPQAMIDQVFESHGFTLAQRVPFMVVLRIPMYFGGANTTDNLMLIARRNYPTFRLLQDELQRDCQRNRRTIEQARQILNEWTE